MCFPNYEDIKCVSVSVARQLRKRGFHYVTYYAHISMQFLDFDEVAVEIDSTKYDTEVQRPLATHLREEFLRVIFVLLLEACMHLLDCISK